MQAVILAAGEGKRFGELTARTNKCLIEIDGKSLIERHIENIISTACFSEIVIVVGYRADQVIAKVEGKHYGIKISFCYQNMERKGIICSIESAAEMIHEDFLLLLGDEFIADNYYEEAARRFLTGKACCMVGICEEKNPDEIKKNYTFRFENGVMKDFVEKPDKVFNSFIGTGNIFFRTEVMQLLKKVDVNPDRNERELVGLLNLLVRESKDIVEFTVGRAYVNVNDENAYKRAADISRNIRCPE